MGFFSSLFKKEKRSHVPPYDRRLISKFHHEHEKLVEHIGEIQKAMELGTLGKSRVKELLKSFKMELLGHFMEEDIKLYWYLKEYYKEDQLSFSVVKEFEDSIKKIQKDVMHFFDHYSMDNVELDEEFKTIFHTIVEELSSRIEAEEENLYPLYISN